MKGRPVTAAHHEAAHAVASYIFGRAIIAVRIIPDHAWGNPVTLYDDLPPVEPGPDHARVMERRLRRDIVVFEAGAAAERRFLHDPSTLVDTANRAELDRKKSLDSASRLLGSSDEHECSQYVKATFVPRAERLVEMLWPAIERVAEELLSRNDLSGLQLDEILADVPHAARPDGEPSAVETALWAD